MKVIETNNLTKYYGKTIGIKNVNLEVEEGDIFGFIGPNGAGKSTTIRTLLNFIFPTSGSAKILGMDIVRDSKEIRKNIGYVSAETNYYSDMTVLEFLKYSASFYGQESDLRLSAMTERLELSLSKKVEELSLGNKKKLAIIQALLHSPRLLIFDEPTSGLDPLMQNVFFEILKEENERTTIFLSSHALSDIQRMCNKVAIIKQGRIVEVQRVEQLRNNQFKTITVEFVNDDELLADLPGIIKSEKDEKMQKILFNGDINTLINSLSYKKISNILIEEPSLEEIFFHYYEKETN